MRYFGMFKEVEDVMANFGEAAAADLNESVVIAAYYDIDGYDGSAMVVYRKEGKLFEVHGSHCSCYGLEDQWKPEEISYEALYDRLLKTQESQVERFGDDFNSALMKGLVDEMFDREVLES